MCINNKLGIVITKLRLANNNSLLYSMRFTKGMKTKCINILIMKVKPKGNLI